MGLLQKGKAKGKEALDSYKKARALKKAANKVKRKENIAGFKDKASKVLRGTKNAKQESRQATRSQGKELRDDAKVEKRARKGQKKLDRREYGSGKKGKANKASDIARKAAVRKMEDVGMDDNSMDDTSMDGASMVNPMRKKPRKKPSTRKPKIKRAKNGVSKMKNTNPPTSVHEKDHPFMDSKTSKNPRKKMGGSMANKKMGGSMAEKKMGGSMAEKKMGASRPDLSKTRKIKGTGPSMSGESYDAKQAYNKNLSASARLHYLENNRAAKKAKGGSHRSTIMKHMKNI